MSKGKRRGRYDALPEPKAAHIGTTAPPYGRSVWLLERCDGTLYGTWKSRHDAIGAATTIANAQWKWFDPLAVPTGAVPLEDIRHV